MNSTSPTARVEKIFDMSLGLSALCALVLVAVLVVGHANLMMTLIAVGFLGVAVMMSVHHAEVIADRVGPSLGALILALSVTVIEVGLIVSLMTNDTADSAVVARDTVFSAVIIVTNGIVGFCLLAGGLRFHELGFNAGGASSLLSILAILSGLTLVLPNFTRTTEGGTYSTAQLVFVSIACVLVYFSLIFAQTVSHKDYYQDKEPAAEHAVPTKGKTWTSFFGLLVTLSVVIGLAKSLSPAIEAGVHAIGAPRPVVGIVIALLVLAPETFAAISAAKANRLQTSLNLALGSGAASIALTIPVVSVFSIMTKRSLVLGLDAKGIVFLLLTFVCGGLTLGGSGRTTALMGVVHLVILFAFVALSFIP